MKIEITEKTGIRTQEYGHMKHGEIREVDDHLGAFYCANGWAKDVSGTVPTGERGKLDRIDPAKWPNDQPKKQIEPGNASHN